MTCNPDQVKKWKEQFKPQGDYTVLSGTIREMQEEWLLVLAAELWRQAGGLRKARAALKKVDDFFKEVKKKSRGPRKPDAFVLQLAAEIQRQNPRRYSKRRALLTAMELIGIPAEELRRFEDNTRGGTLEQATKDHPVKFTGRIPIPVQQLKRRAPKTTSIGRPRVVLSDRAHVPKDVRAARDAALAKDDRTAAQRLMGDPPSHRSALSRRTARESPDS